MSSRQKCTKIIKWEFLAQEATKFTVNMLFPEPTFIRGTYKQKALAQTPFNVINYNAEKTISTSI